MTHVKNVPRNPFYILRQKEQVTAFLRYAAKIYFLLSTEYRLFHKFFFFFVEIIHNTNTKI